MVVFTGHDTDYYDEMNFNIEDKAEGKGGGCGKFEGYCST